MSERRGLASLRRPLPPAEVLSGETPFARARDVEDWLLRVFIREDGPLFSERHAVLDGASLGVLWAHPDAKRKGLLLAGQANIPSPPVGAFGWARALWEFQMAGFFGSELPDFVLTFSARAAAEAEDASWCALAKHELCHCGQAEDEFGSPKFRSAMAGGGPVWTLVPHDVEEFADVVEAYGPAATGPRVERFLEAAKRGPQVNASRISLACGTCALRAVA